jgi:aquaporin Z
MRRYAAEFIGTFFLVLTVGAVSVTQNPLAPLAIGGVLAAMIFAGGHVSGGHFNPAVTIAVLLRGRMAGRDVLPYVGAQLLGGAAAAGMARLVLPAAPSTPFSTSALGAAFTVELLVTFALAYVVLNVATSRSHRDNSFYGVAIGLTVLAGAVAFGGISGGAFNPAVGLGTAIAGLTAWSMLWVYLLPTMLGGALAALAFRLIHPNDVAPDVTLVDKLPTEVSPLTRSRHAA